MISTASGNHGNGPAHSAPDPPLVTGNHGNTQGHGGPLYQNEGYTDTVEADDFLNKVCKFELISRGKGVPTFPLASNGGIHGNNNATGIKSPSVLSPGPFSPGEHRTGGRGVVTVTGVNSSYVGEKLFTKDTATTRMSATLLSGPANTSTSVRPLSGSAHVSVTPGSGPASASPLPVSNYNAAHAAVSVVAPQSSSARISNTSSTTSSTSSASESSVNSATWSWPPGADNSVTMFGVQRNKTSPMVGDMSGQSPITGHMTNHNDSGEMQRTNGWATADGDRGSGGSSRNNDDSGSSSSRNTFDGLDFDFNELTASQQDLTLKHQEMVSERRREQEQKKQEYQRLEDIINMCAEYGRQVHAVLA
jgi:hypothetical protein